jgi:hypothetical protein
VVIGREHDRPLAPEQRLHELRVVGVVGFDRVDGLVPALSRISQRLVVSAQPPLDTKARLQLPTDRATPLTAWFRATKNAHARSTGSVTPGSARIASARANSARA